MNTYTREELSRDLDPLTATPGDYAVQQEREFVPASVARGLVEALKRLAAGEDSPTVPALGCGIEDRDLQGNAYEAAEYAWQEAEERFMEWVQNEARAALAAAEVE